MNYKELYKKGVDLGEQQQRRQNQVLKEQKQRRLQEQDEGRHLDELADSLEAGPICKNQRHQKNASKRLRLQQSEWLRHKPEELNDWLMVPCPKGKRCLVIASNGCTRVYNKAGKQIMQLRTLLPGDGSTAKLKSLLDCVYVEALDCFYVLDVLGFGKQPLIDCEASFRFYWLRARFEDNEELSKLSKRNEKTFRLLDRYDFDSDLSVEAALQQFPQWPDDSPQLDGLLFYHKEASYTCGTTPLVCWLFAFMVPDILGLPVNENYISPSDYNPLTPLVYMDEFDRKLMEQQKLYKNAKKSTRQVAMELGAEQQDENDDGYSLTRLLDQERSLEMGESDMDYAAVEATVTCSDNS